MHQWRLSTCTSRQGTDFKIWGMQRSLDFFTDPHVFQLEAAGVQVTSLARGVPVGGELDYLDDGTLAAAFKSRSSV